MAKKAKKRKAQPKPATKPAPKAPDLAQLRKPVLAARARLEAAEAEARQAAERARKGVAQAKHTDCESLTIGSPTLAC